VIVDDLLRLCLQPGDGLESDAAAEQDVDTAQAALAALGKLFTQHRALTDMLVDDAGALTLTLSFTLTLTLTLINPLQLCPGHRRELRPWLDVSSLKSGSARHSRLPGSRAWRGCCCSPEL